MDRPETAGVRPTGVGVISSPGEASTIHRELVARHSQELHLLDFPGVTVGVGLDANKGHALYLLCRDFGIERDEVAAIGDSVTMLMPRGPAGGTRSHSDRCPRRRGRGVAGWRARRAPARIHRALGR
jgi:hypothetical protein